MRAYEIVTGQEMPNLESQKVREPLGSRWEEGQLPELYPRLAKKFWEDTV